MDSLSQQLRTQIAPAYRLERELGRGAMGVVFLARQVSLDRPVAIKAVHPDQVSPAALLSFRREAELLARVRHPNVIAVHAILDGPVPCVVMDHVDGGSLRERLLLGPLPPGEAVALGLDLLAGVGAIHRAGLLHRDLKPANILLAPGRACIADLGLATEHDAAERSSPTGTAGYQAPEQFDHQEVGQWTDLHGVGAILYEALSGRRWSWQAGRRPDWHGIPFGLARILARALDTRVQRRWRDAESFARALRRYTGWRQWRPAAAVALCGTLVVVGVGKFGPAPPTAADVAVRPFHGCTAEDPLAAVAGAYVGYGLASFGRLRVVLPEREEPAQFTLRGDRECAPSSRLVLVIEDSSGRGIEEFHLSPQRADPVEWSRMIADTLLARLWPRRLADFRATHGKVPAAVAAFYEGEDAFHRDEWLEAVPRYREALRRDPGLAYARWRMIIALMWAREPHDDELRSLTESSGLPPTLQRLAHALMSRSLPERMAELRAIAESVPDDPEPAFLYANELFARGPLLGIPLDSALSWFARARERSPYERNAPALTHLAWGAIRLGRRADAAHALDARTALGSGNDAGGIDIVKFLRLAYFDRFHPRTGRLLHWLAFRNAGPGDLAELAKVHRLALTFDLPDAQVELAERILRGSDGPPSPSVLVGAALGLLATGRPVAALSRLDSAMAGSGAVEDSLQSLEWRLLPGALGYPGVPAGSRDSARTALEDRARGESPAGRVLLALGLDAYAATDTAGLRRWLEWARPIRHTDSVTSRQIRFLEALDLAAHHEYRAALERSAALAAEHRTRRLGGVFVRAALRVLRARWHLALADSAAAIADLTWYQNSDLNAWPAGEAQAGEVDAVFGVVARVERASLLRARGSDHPACGDLTRARELLARAEPGFGPFKARLDSLARGCG